MAKITIRTTKDIKKKLIENQEKNNFKSLAGYLLTTSLSAKPKTKIFFKKIIPELKEKTEIVFDFRVDNDTKELIEKKADDFGFPSVSEYVLYVGLTVDIKMCI